ncbi:MAG: hypothetical protein ACHP79_12035, partial [Terriglobales bacterium]
MNRCKTQWSGAKRSAQDVGRQQLAGQEGALECDNTPEICKEFQERKFGAVPVPWFSTVEVCASSACPAVR